VAGFDHCVLRRWRHESGLSPELVCVRAQMSYPYLRALEDGRRVRPSIELLARLAEVYGRDIRELFTGSDGEAEPAGAR
jgi:transcriptional regulator with XRE-family HTH domain